MRALDDRSKERMPMRTKTISRLAVLPFVVQLPARRSVAVVLAVLLVASACGSGDDEGSDQPIVFTDNGWIGGTRVVDSRSYLLPESCDPSSGIPGPSSEGLISLDGDSFVHARNPDGTSRYYAAKSGGLIVATLDSDPLTAQWSAAASMPFERALDVMSPSNLDGIAVTEVADEPLADGLRYDLVLEASIPSDELNAQAQRHAADIERLIQSAPATLRPGSTVRWSRWWLDRQLVAEQFLLPQADGCGLEISTYTQIDDDQTDAIELAELVFGVDVQQVIDRAASMPETDGFVDIQVPIPIPPPFGGGSGPPPPTLFEAGTRATRLAPRPPPVGGGPSLGYLAAVAAAVYAAKGFESLGDAIGCALAGDCGLDFSEAPNVDNIPPRADVSPTPPDDGGFEDNELECRGLQKNDDEFGSDVLEDLDDLDPELAELFDELVGDIKYTNDGKPISTIPDSVAGGHMYEMKGRYGSTTPLSASYQLRLQIFIAAASGLQFVLVTDRPLSGPLQDIIDETGGVVERPIDW